MSGGDDTPTASVAASVGGGALSVADSKGDDLTAAVAPLEVIPLERYVVGRELARGGMGRVLEAWDPRHQRPVAIKVLLRGGADAARRFVREAAVTARLHHPAIVPLYETGRWPSGEPFFVMKRFAGRSLAEAIAAPGLALLPQLVAVADALAHAHAHGVVHRDLKPANVLVGDSGEVVVIDWGLAKELGVPEVEGGDPDAPVAPGLTVAGRALGTPSYMPPEQARGEPATTRSDVYALGAVLYHALSGSPPYPTVSGREALELVKSRAPEPIQRRAPRLPVDLCAIVEKAMARDPADRYPDARALAQDLHAFVAGGLVSALDYSPLRLLGRWLAARRVPVAAAAAALVALAFAAGLGVRGVVVERDRAELEQQRAGRERAAALAQRDAADALVDFVVNDLRARLEPLGRLDVLENVGPAVEAYRAASPRR